jgi:3-oxoacyl-[acyl-carrier-protein] synthase II
MPATSRPVVITGLGAVTGLGVGMNPLWDGLCAGRSALRPITRFDPSGFPSRLGAEVGANGDGPFSAKDYVPKHYRKAVKVMARDIELAVVAAKFAVEDAGLQTRGTLLEGSVDPTTYKLDRMGCHIGAGLISAEADELAMAFATARREGNSGELDLHAWGARGMENLTPLWLLKYLPNMLACHVTILHGCEGPSNTITCAEASGLLSIGESTRVIERGDADLCFSGGAESKLNLMGLLRMDFAKRVAATGSETDGGKIVRPFDPQSAGGLLGEAGGILILESLDTAKARGSRPYAIVAGIGAGHSPRIGGPSGENEGNRIAIENALADAEIKPDQIDAIVPTACGSPDTDATEAAALRAVFGEGLARIPLVTLPPQIGNCAAGTGSIQAAVAARIVREQRLPARLHAGTPAPGLDAGRADSRPARIRYILASTGSQGGQNAAIVLSTVA